MPVHFYSGLSLSDFGNYASVIGLFISIFTLFLVSKLKKKYNFRSRVEEHRKALQLLSSEISSLLADFDKNLSEIDERFAIANVKLRDIQKGSSGDLDLDVKSARSKIKKFRLQHKLNLSFYTANERLARLIYTEINVVVEELFNVRKEIMGGG